MWNIRNILSKLDLFTSKNFSDYETLNQSISNIPAILDGSGKIYESHLVAIKMFYFSKFIYENDEENLDLNLVENTLFHFGTVAIAKLDKTYVIGRFKVKKYDINNKPILIKIIPKNTKNKSLSTLYEVGKNAVIINGIANFWESRSKWGMFFMIEKYLKDLQLIYTNIIYNVYMGKNYLPIPINASSKYKSQIADAMFSTTPIIPYENSTISGLGSLGKETKLWDFRDRTVELWDNYFNVWNIILDLLGCSSNASPKKKERQISAEIESFNSFSEGIYDTEIKFREVGIRQLNKVFALNITLTQNEEKIEEGVDNGKQERAQKQGNNNTQRS